MHRLALHLESRSFKGCTGYVLEPEQNLENWVIAQAALGLQFFDNFLERDFLVGVAIERRLPYARQQFAESWLA